MAPIHRLGGAGAGVGAGDPLGALAAPGLPAGAGAGAIPIGVGGATVTPACPLIVPSVATTCAVPGLCPVTSPLASTLATLAALLLHVTWLVTSAVLLSAYVPVALYRCACPTFSVAVLGVTAMLTSAAPVIVTSPVPALPVYGPGDAGVYVAVRWCGPTASALVVNVATPPTTGALPSGVPPSVNETFPVGVGRVVVVAGAIVAVSVTGLPCAAVGGAMARVVVVPRAVTTMPVWVPVIVAVVVSVAVREKVPALPKAAAKGWTPASPAAKEKSAGRAARGSVLVRWTVPV
jgi:hypothetical protein